MFDRSHRIRSLAVWLVSGLLAAAASPVFAQYPGHVDTVKKTVPMPRAIAVVEWTGPPGAPSASRMIPISVYDGENYQPGGLYLARPEPLAVESGTEYILQRAGIPQGLFDVQAAQDVEGYWLGYGTWKPLAAARHVHKLAPAKVMPQVVGREDDRPHFKNRNPPTANGKQSGQASPQPSTTQAGSASDQTTNADPDRPTLRRRSAASAEDAKARAISGGPETVVGGADPDRPHMAHGSAHPTDPGFEASKLAGSPANLQQMIAVSDAVDREPHPYTYAWADPGDAAKMQAQMEVLAQKALAPPAPASTRPTAKRTGKVTRRPASSTHARQHTPAHAAPALPALSVVTFHAYQLTYDSGATLVLSAQSIDAAGNVRYITLIGQPDFYGAAHVIFQSITDDAHLDEMPRMLLVDAVDPKAENRGDLVFELRGRHDRQFAIYRVSTGQVEQVFTTGSLPLSPAPAADDSPDS